MIKQGVIRTGKSPSAASGKPSDMIKKGEALRHDEKIPKGPEALEGQIPIDEKELTKDG